MHLGSPEDQVQAFFVAAIEAVEQNRSTLAKDGELRGVQTGVSLLKVILRRPVSRGGEYGLLFYDEAEGVAVDGSWERRRLSEQAVIRLSLRS